MDDLNSAGTLPLIFCGPILRRVTRKRVVIWWISPKSCKGRCDLLLPGKESPIFSRALDSDNIRVMQAGKHCFVHLLNLTPDRELPVDEKIEYDLTLQTDQGDTNLGHLLPGILYPGEKHPSFMVKPVLKKLLHGSCRNPHHNSDDSLIAGDREVQNFINDPVGRPALLMMSGDQIYADHVAGPMLQAIHRVINLLGIHEETFSQAVVEDSNGLYHSPDCYYLRDKILPKTKVGNKWYRRGGLHPVFTSTYANNHLITFGELLAMYILVWSPELWSHVRFDGTSIPETFKEQYEKERVQIKKFTEGLANARRLFANIPCYMIFDDHDVTDDWNLTAQWELSAYTHPFSRRIIGNAMMAYWLCQGWGNGPDYFDTDFMAQADSYFKEPTKTNHDRFIEELFIFERWHFELPTTPKLIVLDSRTRRWRSERRLSSPSGLMDWEALMEFQQAIIDEESVVIVAPAPMFGVKLIETIQHIVTFFGYPLVVDAENWMAHPGSAYTLLQIFKHLKTPYRFVILSGDVHYSFAYDIDLRFRDNSPRLWQITSSGIKNEFPLKVIKWLDRLNRWLYAPYSPLNLFTKRRDMKIRYRIPEGRGMDRLVNTSGLGLVCLDDDGSPTRICEIYANREPLYFRSKKQKNI